ncbi:MAG: hypothetical protein GY720_05660 [bacterium]|nr:hypothetical protein [bacterium]
MKETSSPLTAVIALVAIAAVVAIAAGLMGGHEETSRVETFDYIAADQPVGAGVVISKTQRGGFEFLGRAFSQPDHFVQVAFTLPASCDPGDSERWPIAQTDCAGPNGLVGPITGGGVTATGEPIVMVEASVDRGCHADIELGMSWPPPTDRCEAQPE